MKSLKEAIIYSKNKDLYYEDKLNALVREFEYVIQKAKEQAQEEINRIAEDTIFNDLEPAKKLAKQTAQEEIGVFKKETNEWVKNILSNVEESKNKVFENVEMKIENAYTSFVGEVKKMLAAAVKELGSNMTEHNEHFSLLSIELKDKFNGIIKQTEDRLVGGFEKRVQNMRGAKGEKGDMGAKGKDGSPDTPEQIAIKVNILEEKIEQKTIKGLRLELQNIHQSIREKKGGGSGGGMGNWVTEQPSGTINGSNMTYTITSNVSGGGKAIILLYQGQVQEYGTHFTVSGKTITMTFAPETGTTLFAMYVRR